MTNGPLVVTPGVTGPLTLNAGVLVYTAVFTVSKYTWKVTLPVPLRFTKSTEPLIRTVSTRDELPIPRDLIVCTGMVSGMPGQRPDVRQCVRVGGAEEAEDIDIEDGPPSPATRCRCTERHQTQPLRAHPAS